MNAGFAGGLNVSLVELRRCATESVVTQEVEMSIAGELLHKGTSRF